MQFHVNYIFQNGIGQVGPYVVYYVYFALVLVEFICQFFPDENALKDWKHKLAAIDESSEDYYEKKPLLDRSQNGAEFLYDEVLIFNIYQHKIFTNQLHNWCV